MAAVQGKVTACIGLTKKSLNGASDSLDGDREIKRRLIGRHNMMTRLWWTASARLYKRLYFISSAIAYCISPYACFYAGLSCFLQPFSFIFQTTQTVEVWAASNRSAKQFYNCSMPLAALPLSGVDNSPFSSNCQVGIIGCLSLRLDSMQGNIWCEHRHQLITAICLVDSTTGKSDKVIADINPSLADFWRGERKIIFAEDLTISGFQRYCPWWSNHKLKSYQTFEDWQKADCPKHRLSHCASICHAIIALQTRFKDWRAVVLDVNRCLLCLNKACTGRKTNQSCWCSGSTVQICCRCTKFDVSHFHMVASTRTTNFLLKCDWTRCGVFCTSEATGTRLSPSVMNPT